MPPPIHYVRNGEVNIAFQVVGDAPIEILMIPGWISHLAMDSGAASAATSGVPILAAELALHSGKDRQPESGSRA